MERNGAANGQQLRPFALSHDAWGQLVLTDADGRQHVGVELVRAFPLSDPRHGIAVCDAAGHEIIMDRPIWMNCPRRWSGRSKRTWRNREFVPIIRRILSVSAPVEPSEWEVETDRGRTSFVLNNEDDVHELGGHRALITDAHGIRYLIPDTRQLDAISRRLLERYL